MNEKRNHRMNWILTLTRNNLGLTKKAIASFLAQDIGDPGILCIDNGSTDGTIAWLNSQPDLFTVFNSHNAGVAKAWNQGLDWIFEANAEHVLVVNNDTVLRHDTIRHLVADGGGFVTAVGHRNPYTVAPDITREDFGFLGAPAGHAVPDPSRKRPHPDFSCFLIRREVWEKVGPFDECFEGAFCEDASYHLRMHRAGIEAYCIDLPFYHVGSATVNLAEPEEQQRICAQADKNRELFKQMYGFAVGSPEYYEEFGHPAPEDHPMDFQDPIPSG